MSVINFSKVRVEAIARYSVKSPSAEVGDNGIAIAVPCGRVIGEDWQIEVVARSRSGRDDIARELKELVGNRGFSWRLRSPVVEDNLTIELDKYGDYVCEGWTESQLGTNLWVFSLPIIRTDNYEIDECILRPSDRAEELPIIPLRMQWGGTRSQESKVVKNQYNEGIIDRVEYGYDSVRDRWELSANLRNEDKDAVVEFLSDRAGRHFGFKPLTMSSVRSYSCTEWECRWLGGRWWQVSMMLDGNSNLFRQSLIKEMEQYFDFYDNEQSIRDAIATDTTDLDSMIAATRPFIDAHTRDTVPFLITNAKEVVNNFHPNILGRGGYFPSAAFPTEAQAIAMRSCVKAYQTTNDTNWLNKAIDYGNALLNLFYPVPIPTNWTIANGIRIPHWLRFKNFRSIDFPLKGAIAVDPLNYGYFDLVVTFMNGEGTIPSSSPHFGDLLSNVYRVYPVSDRLLWQNVYARPLGGVEYAIDYWVSWNENGVNTRYFSDTESPGGRSPIPTSETIGKIKLATNYTGQAHIVYAARTGAIVPPNQSMLLEPYPMWRELRAGEALGAIDIFPWAHEGYALLHQATGDNKWVVARDCTDYTEKIAANVINPSAWYKKDDSPNAFAYAGSQFIPVPSTRSFTASRVTSGAFKDYLQVAIANELTPFPSGEYQNYAVQIQLITGCTITVEAGCSVATELEIVLSLSKNPFDFSLYYIARLSVFPNTPANRTYAIAEFLLWDLVITSWHPYIADSPIYDYSGAGGQILEKLRLETVIDTIPRNVWKIRQNPGNGFTGVGFVMLGVRPRFPLSIYMLHSGNARFKVNVGDRDYYCNVPTAANWQLVSIAANQFKDIDDKSPSSSSAIASIEIQSVSGTSETWIWYIGQAPKQLQPPVQTYKATIVSRVPTAHNLFVGDFFATGAPTEDLAYGDSAVVFTANAESDGDGGQFIAAWRGLKASGYQYPSHYVRTAQWRRLRGVLQFLLDAQEARKLKLGYYSSFESAFVTPYWDNIEYSPNGELNVWTNQFSDPNYYWVGYSVRPLESVAEAWSRLVNNDFPGDAPGDRDQLIKQCKTICDRYAFWLSSYYVRRRKYSPPTVFYDYQEPSTTYHEPHAAGFFLGFATWALSAGGNPALYWRILKASYNYLQDSFAIAGTMNGSFSKLQPSFTEGSFTGNEYFGFWHFEILERLCLFKQKKTALPYPKCVYFIKKNSWQL